MIHYKKILAISLTASMVLGSSVVALADENGSTSGTGSLDIVEKSDVFKVDLPTIPDSGDTTFNYILDPTGVISATGAEKYNNASFGAGTVFFANKPTTEGGSVSYSATSDALKITNKSTMDVDITVKASVKAVNGITMSETSTFEDDDTEAKLYLALKDDVTANADKAITTTGAELKATVAALEDAYETKYVDGKYIKELKTDATGFESYSFQVTGSCNPKGTWTGLTETPPEIEVVWSVKDPTVTGPQMSVDSKGLITMTGFTAEQNYASMIIVDGEGTEWDVTVAPYRWIGNPWDEKTGGNATMQLGEQWTKFLIEKGGNVTIKLTLTDKTVKTASATITE